MNYKNERVKIIEDKNLILYNDKNNENKDNIIKKENTININKYKIMKMIIIRIMK